MKNLNLKNLVKSQTALKKRAMAAGVVITVLLAGYFGYDYYTTQKELSEYKDNSDVVVLKEREDLLKALNKLVLLPEGEEPTIATITNAANLHNQKFFIRAENGDKVIIYPVTQRAILYRPSIKKIIESAPVSINDLEGVGQRADTKESTPSNNVLGENTEETAKEEPQAPQEPAKIAIYNGTLYVEGLATDVAYYIEGILGVDKVFVDIISNAEDIYDETIIIDVSGKYIETVNELQTILSAKIEEKPEDVDYPAVDIIIIAGKDITENESIEL